MFVKTKIIDYNRSDMDDAITFALEGRKTFFIATEPSLLPESYLEDYLTRGYETYIIADDRNCPLVKKVESIINIFEDSILFFYIDAEIIGLNWKQYIKQLQERFGDQILIGVLYSKRHNDDERRRIEKYYLFDVGIQGGCISLEFQKAKNFALIDKVMFANQASGRRKNVRAICDNNSKVTFVYNSIEFTATLSDISLTHFSCTIPGESYIPLYEKIKNVFVDINGLHFKTDAILLLQRVIKNKMLYVFIFSRHDGSQGLDGDLKHRLSEKIYQMVTNKVKMILQLVFDEVGRGDRDPKGHTTFQPADLVRLL